MYQENKAFQNPDDEEIIIWRYMDFWKFVSILDKKALYFCISDRLDDPFEGSLTQINVKKREEYLMNFWKKMITDEELKELLQRDPKRNKELRKCVFVNCWHMNDSESAAMWKLYLKSNKGIAIQSTFAKLKRSFDADRFNTVYIGKLNYIDYDSYAIPRNNLLNPFLHKRKSFEHEKELRAIFLDINLAKQALLPREANAENNGRNIEVDLNKLIERVYVAPKTKDWFHDLVESIAKKYKLLAKIEKSKLNEEAWF